METEAVLKKKKKPDPKMLKNLLLLQEMEKLQMLKDLKLWEDLEKLSGKGKGKETKK